MSDARAGESRAEPPASSKRALVAGGLLVAALALALTFALTRPRVTNAPSGLAGVKLGGTLSDAKQALPGLAVEGELHRARARVFDEPATCTLAISRAERVSRIECVVDPSPLAFDKLLATLRELYGKESSMKADTWLWQNERTSLALSRGADASIKLASFTTAEDH